MAAVRRHKNGAFVAHFHSAIEIAAKDLVLRGLLCGIPRESWELTPLSQAIDPDTYHPKDYPIIVKVGQAPAVQAPAVQAVYPGKWVMVSQEISTSDPEVLFGDRFDVQLVEISPVF